MRFLGTDHQPTALRQQCHGENEIFPRERKRKDETHHNRPLRIGFPSQSRGVFIGRMG